MFNSPSDTPSLHSIETDTPEHKFKEAFVISFLASCKRLKKEKRKEGDIQYVQIYNMYKYIAVFFKIKYELDIFTIFKSIVKKIVYIVKYRIHI